MIDWSKHTYRSVYKKRYWLHTIYPDLIHLIKSRCLINGTLDDYEMCKRDYVISAQILVNTNCLKTNSIKNSSYFYNRVRYD